MMRRCLSIGIGLMLGLAAITSQAQEWPSKPVRIVVTFTTGGAADITARVLAERLGDLWKQTVVVENRIGAGGNIGVEAVHRSPADGYTLLLFSNTHAINMALYPKLSFDLMRDFAPVLMTTSTPIVFAVHPRVAVNNMREFTELLRARPGKLDYATCGIATAHHFAMEMYKFATKTFAVHIPHRGCSPAVTDAVGGQVDIVVVSLAAALPFIKQNRLRPLALTTVERAPSAPDIPTMRESGIAALKDFEVENYYGLMVPAATPAAVRAKIDVDVRRVLAMPEVRSRLSGAGLDQFVLSADAAAKLVRDDIVKYRRVIQDANIKPE